MKAKTFTLKKTEAQEHSMLCQWLKIKYPKCIFNTDMSGIKLSIGVAIKASTLRSHNGFPDLFIIEPRNKNGIIFSGLFIELKRTGEKLFKKDGVTPINEHVAEQMFMQTKLRSRGFKCEFAIGFLQAQNIINDYLK